MATQTQSQIWTTAKRINFSQHLANAFCPGLAPIENRSRDRWTTEGLIRLSQNLAQSYGSDR